MLVSEILRIKGTVLFTTPPDAPVMDAVKVMASYQIGQPLQDVEISRLVAFLRTLTGESPPAR